MSAPSTGSGAEYWKRRRVLEAAPSAGSGAEYFGGAGAVGPPRVHRDGEKRRRVLKAAQWAVGASVGPAVTIPGTPGEEPRYPQHS
jgi:hypothetical protein